MATTMPLYTLKSPGRETRTDPAVDRVLERLRNTILTKHMEDMDIRGSAYMFVKGRTTEEPSPPIWCMRGTLSFPTGARAKDFEFRVTVDLGGDRKCLAGIACNASEFVADWATPPRGTRTFFDARQCVQREVERVLGENGPCVMSVPYQMRNKSGVRQVRLLTALGASVVIGAVMGEWIRAIAEHANYFENSQFVDADLAFDRDALTMLRDAINLEFTFVPQIYQHELGAQFGKLKYYRNRLRQLHDWCRQSAKDMLAQINRANTPGYDMQ